MNFYASFSKNTRRIGMLVILTLLAVSCTTQTPTPAPTEAPFRTPTVDTTPSPTITATPRPTPTPTQLPLGSEGNPITIGFIITPEETAAIDAAEEIAILISQDTEFAVESLFYPDFQSLSAAVQEGSVDLFWLGPLEYIYLNWEGAAHVVLLSNHLGVYAYGVQFMANVLSGFQIYYDPDTNLTTGDPVAALQQFSGTRPCFINPDSIPGYYAPLGLLANTSTPILDPVFTYDYSATIRALYIRGICDFGVSYALTGDPRTASDIIQDIPSVQDQVIVVWQSDGIIPNTNLSAATHLPVHIRHRMQEAFLDLADLPEGLQLLSTALKYDVEALKTIEDIFYNPLRAAIVPLELDLAAITSQTVNP